MKQKPTWHSTKSCIRNGSVPLQKSPGMTKAELILQHISAAVQKNELQKITLGNKRDEAAEIKNIYIKPVMIKGAPMLSFIYRYPTKDITKNFSAEEAVKNIKEILESDFFNADVFTSAHTFYFSSDKQGKEKLISKAGVATVTPVAHSHDREKKRIICLNAPYLKALGITTSEGNLKKEMQHKFRQINRYMEIIEGIIKEEQLTGGFYVMDMGSGKGYLTFALYDHLQGKNIDVHLTGIELRPELVELCNSIAENCGYKNLHFKKGSIQDTPAGGTDMLIALHACDTATDDAIAKGIKAGAKFIICAPCCHKQIRKQMAPGNVLKNITKHGILLERQAEMVTDTIRALMLEAHGYKTKVFEFIEEEDTPKNVLIVGTKAKASSESLKENLEKIRGLKELFGIKEHYLETIL